METRTKAEGNQDIAGLGLQNKLFFGQLANMFEVV